MAEQQLFDVFLSHNSKDKDAVRELAVALKERGLRVWLDEWELMPGRPWQEALEQIIETTRSAAVLVGKDGLGPWQDAEMRGCLSEFVNEKPAPVIPVLLPGAPQRPKLPLFLKGFTWVDFRGGITEDGLDRLQRGITGKKPDPEDAPVGSKHYPRRPRAAWRSMPHPSKPITVAVTLVAVAILAGLLLYFRWPFEPQAGATLGDERTGITFVYIPPGKFQMGSTKGEQNEKPIHTVTISRGFLLGKHEVTNSQYDRFLKASPGHKKPKYWKEARFNGPDQPVIGVSWEDAQDYCEWAGCRLPTEAEWEYACRAGSTTEYYFGDDAEKLGEYAWFGEDFKRSQTHEVGDENKKENKKENNWGLRDMHGNVWEWCQDGYRRYRQDSAIDPQGPDNGPYQVIRGGCWFNSPELCRSARRVERYPGHDDAGIGFRIASSPSVWQLVQLASESGADHAGRRAPERVAPPGAPEREAERSWPATNRTR